MGTKGTKDVFAVFALLCSLEISLNSWAIIRVLGDNMQNRSRDFTF